MREYKWESIKNISGAKGKFKRALLQLTPVSWSAVRWLDPQSGSMRLIAVIQFMLIWQMVELNTFFIKHIFPMPAEHPICVFRITLWPDSCPRHETVLHLRDGSQVQEGRN